MCFTFILDECNCDPGWGRKSCLLDLSVVPVISYITGGGKCDPSVHECWEFIIETNGLADRFFAQVVALEVMRPSIFTKQMPFVIPIRL